MTSKEELLKRFKEERIAREKARIQMLHDMNRKKYGKNDENSWKYSKCNSSLNMSPVKNLHKRGPVFVNGQMKRPRVKNSSSFIYGNCLNMSTPISGNESFPTDLTPKSRSIQYSKSKHNSSFDYNSPTPTCTEDETN